MKKTGKVWFFVVAILIGVLAFTAFFGISTHYGDTENIIIKGAKDIRFGIDIRGGVDATFVPKDNYKATEAEMKSVEEVIKLRLLNLNVTDYEVYVDNDKSRIIVRFPWKQGETEFNAEKAIEEIGATAHLTFREGAEVDAAGLPTGVTKDNIIVEGKNVVSAEAQTGIIDGVRKYYVSLKLDKTATKTFAEATNRLAGNGYISIWMDDEMFSRPFVSVAINDGNAMIDGSQDFNEAMQLAAKINAGSLPFSLEAESFSSISPTLGSNSLRAMVIAGVIAFIIVGIYMISL
ncbi:MAG: protein translocase subunit SecD, partial [Oscillospiraceae bacterium]